MYLGCSLLEAGKALLPTSERARQGGQPDLCVIDGERRIWIEAITPDRGQHGPDAVAGPRSVNDSGGWEAALLAGDHASSLSVNNRAAHVENVPDGAPRSARVQNMS